MAEWRTIRVGNFFTYIHICVNARHCILNAAKKGIRNLSFSSPLLPQSLWLTVSLSNEQFLCKVIANKGTTWKFHSKNVNRSNWVLGFMFHKVMFNTSLGSARKRKSSIQLLRFSARKIKIKLMSDSSKKMVLRNYISRNIRLCNILRFSINYFLDNSCFSIIRLAIFMFEMYKKKAGINFLIFFILFFIQQTKYIKSFVLLNKIAKLKTQTTTA